MLGSHSTCANREVNTCWKYEYTPIPGFPNSGPGVIVWSLGSLFASPSVCEVVILSRWRHLDSEDCHDKKGWSLSKQQCLNFPNFLLIFILSHYFLHKHHNFYHYIIPFTPKKQNYTSTKQNSSKRWASWLLLNMLCLGLGTQHSTFDAWRHLADVAAKLRSTAPWSFSTLKVG